METLNYKVLEQTGYHGYILKDAPVKVMQFGEGNFLRAFVDYFYDIANEKAGYNGKVKLVQPIGNFPQMADWINEQEGLYTLYLRGSEKGQKVDAKRVISCVSDCVCPYVDDKWDEVLALARSADLETVVSNTTEAGIAYTQGDSAFDQVPPNSFPAKLTRVLYERYKAFQGAADKGHTSRVLQCRAWCSRSCRGSRGHSWGSADQACRCPRAGRTSGRCRGARSGAYLPLLLR